jgi:hypothetical protein
VMSGCIGCTPEGGYFRIQVFAILSILEITICVFLCGKCNWPHNRELA